MLSCKQLPLSASCIAICALLFTCTFCIAAEPSAFYVKPYIQLGNNPQLTNPENAVVCWFSERDQDSWKVEVKTEGSDQWIGAKSDIHKHQVFEAQRKRLYQYSCELHGLPPGKVFDYRVVRQGKSVFSAWAMARKAADQPIHFSVFGDCGAGTEGQKLIAWECYKTRPDFVVMPGDIVYNNGLFSEYMTRFFPVYNNDEPDRFKGVPLLRSSTIAAVIGNHDIALSFGLPVNLTRCPDALAYFVIWEPPMNGPFKTAPKNHLMDTLPNVPELGGTAEQQKAFLKSAGSQYPRTAMYSFDYGNSHWLALDGNQYMDWRDPKLRQWVEDDLNGSQATWKFVTFHQPGFSCDTEHSTEQRMRLLSDVFERCGVDIVFTGHVHNYQRTYPMTFKAEAVNGEPLIHADGTVSGAMQFDKKFDGKTTTVPHGVIYVVSGGGGARLYGMRKDCLPEISAGESFVHKFVANTHSFSDCHIDGTTLTLTQTSASGAEIDRFTVTKK